MKSNAALIFLMGHEVAGGKPMSVRSEERITRYRPVTIDGIYSSHAATSMDYSENGLGIITTIKLIPGDSLTVSCPDFWPRTRSAVVVWIKPESISSIRAGLMLH
jgi:hypothetical protein